MTATLLVRGDDGPPVHPALAELPFPDPDTLRPTDGARDVCSGPLADLMRRRHYHPVPTARTGGDEDAITCRYGVPRAYLIEDGAADLQVELRLVRGEQARERYRLDAAPGPDDDGRYAFPVGEEGVVRYREDGTARAAFRSGDAAYRLELSGERVGFPDAGDGRPHSAEVLFRELADLVRLLAGDAPDGPGPATAPETPAYPGELPRLDAPALPLSGADADRCAPLAPLAERLRLVRNEKRDSSEGHTRCHYAADRSAAGEGPDADADGDAGAAGGRLLIWVDVADAARHGGDEHDARESLGAGLRAALADLRRGGGPAARVESVGPLYALPYGEFGHLFHARQRAPEDRRFGRLRAGYVVGTAEVRIEIHGSRPAGADGGSGGTVALGEDELTAYLAEVLEAMAAAG